jgi:putative methyltransferase (TIGR04325 family)
MKATNSLTGKLIKAMASIVNRPHLFNDDVNDWHDAVRNSSGYADERILNQVLMGVRAVAEGRAVYERDSKAFSTQEYSWHLIASLLLAASINHGTLKVLDVGGSIASTFIQCKPILDKIANVTWTVVEQPHFVSAVPKYFNYPNLFFFTSIESAVSFCEPNLVHFGSSLQYFKDPFETLREVGSTSAQVMLIDRIPVTDLGETKISVQRVPRDIYPASYPCWLFSSHEFQTILKQHWTVGAVLPSLGGSTFTTSGTEVTWTAFVCWRD